MLLDQSDSAALLFATFDRPISAVYWGIFGPNLSELRGVDHVHARTRDCAFRYQAGKSA
jgi:hypothetical protein